MEFLSGALDGLRLLATLELHIIVVTNQAGIALGMFTADDMSRFNAEIRSRVRDAGGRIDAFYFCPHLEAKDLSFGASPCECSKPAPGLLYEAATDFGLHLHECICVGDKNSDVLMGKAAGCRTILLKTGKAGREEGRHTVTPEYFADDLLQAATIIQTVTSQE